MYLLSGRGCHLRISSCRESRITEFPRFIFITSRIFTFYEEDDDRLLKYLVFSFKGAVSVILSDPPCKKGNARFTKPPSKALSDQV